MDQMPAELVRMREAARGPLRRRLLSAMERQDFSKRKSQLALAEAVKEQLPATVAPYCDLEHVLRCVQHDTGTVWVTCRLPDCWPIQTCFVRSGGRWHRAPVSALSVDAIGPSWWRVVRSDDDIEWAEENNFLELGAALVAAEMSPEDVENGRPPF